MTRAGVLGLTYDVVLGAIVLVSGCQQQGSVGSLLASAPTADAGPASVDGGVDGVFPCGTTPLGPALVLPDYPRGGRSFYVSPEGNDSSDGLASTTPFRTLQHAADQTAPGDTVFAMSGVYATNGIALDIKTSGTPSAWITYQAMPGEHPILRFSSAGGIRGRGIAYVVIDGFEIEGNSKQVTQDYADGADPLDPATNSTGIEVALDEAKHPAHHVVIRNNVAHHASAAGISLLGVDHVTIEHNVVYGNSRWSKYATSGISVGLPVDVDGETGPKILVVGNVVYDNVELVSSAFYNPPRITNGNGIIVFDTLHVDDNRPDLEYRGRIQVAGNVAFQNGGPGIHLFRARRTDIAFNTLYLNGLTASVGEGQLDTNQCDDVAVRGNVLWGRDDESIDLSTDDGANVLYDYNVYFHYRGSPARSGTNDLTVDPRLRDPACNDLRLRPDSPAIDTGPAGLGITTDLLGHPRPSGSGTDRGAYEVVP